MNSRIYINRTFPIILVVACFSTTLSAQETEEMLTIRGQITYLTSDQIFTDIGSDIGAAVGDTIIVFRRNDEIGLIEITRLSSKYSVCKPLTSPDEFQLGDRLILTKARIKSQVRELTEAVYETVESTESVPRSRKLTHGGRLAIRSYRLYNSGDFDNSDRTVSTMRYRLRFNLPVETNLNVYGRRDLSQSNFTIYQARASFGGKEDTYHVEVGRIFSYELAPVGVTDGLLFSRKLKSNLFVGGLIGIQPEPSSFSLNKDRKKIGIYASLAPTRKEILSIKARFNGSAAYTTEYYKGGNDREFLYLKLNSNLSSKADLRYSQTFDFDRTGSVTGRGKVQSTTLQLSVGIHPIRWLSFDSRLTSRRQVRYLTSQSMTPDSLFFNAARTGINNTVRINAGNFGSIRVGTNIRKETDSRKSSFLIRIGYRNILRHRHSIFGGVSYLENLFSFALKTQVGYRMPLSQNITSSSEIEIYNYSFGRRRFDNARYAFSENIDWKVTRGYHLSIAGEYFADKRLRQFYLFLQAFYVF